SMGGTVATMLAGVLGERIGALVLAEGLGPPAMPPEAAPERMALWLKDLGRSRERQRLASLEDVAARLRAAHGGLVPEPVLRRLSAELTTSHPSGRGLAWRFDPLHRTTSPGRFDADALRAYARRVRAPVLLLDGGGFSLDDAAER